MAEFEKKGIMPHPTGGWRRSRDHGMTLDCVNKECYLNSAGSYCSSPSSVKINSTGVCVLWQQYKDRKK